MNYPWLETYLLSKPSAKKEHQPEWDADRFLIGNKMFALIGEDKNNLLICTLKCEIAFGQLVRENYPNDVTPGYYMNKLHWNTVYLNGQLPDSVFKEMIDQSFDLVLSSLPKKTQLILKEPQNK